VLGASDTVVVALSGGVDSATCAAMLVAAGRRVVGLSMRLYDASGTRASAGGRCCGPRDLEDARAVCAHLGIPFYVVDETERFARSVVDDFTREYAAGRTPNPCVRCNEHVKFGPLVRRARALGASSLATGHYARIVRDPVSFAPRIARAVDRAKDQSYFLFAVGPDMLGFVEFPLGGLTKDDVRARARAFGLPNADKPDSQEICFVPDGDHARLVERRVAPAAGEIVDQAGQVLGTHGGVHRFTVGQRHGLGIAARAPLYVIRLDALTRRVVVGPQAALARRQVAVADVRWSGVPPAAVAPVQAQIRYRHAARPATVRALPGDRAELEFTEPERAVAPGQAAVFYDGDVVVGGGWIEAAA
jgi:tRNA-specific 2-thiouridylase